jgi:hypothetical protein
MKLIRSKKYFSPAWVCMYRDYRCEGRGVDELRGDVDDIK